MMFFQTDRLPLSQRLAERIRAMEDDKALRYCLRCNNAYPNEPLYYKKGSSICRFCKQRSR